MKFKSLVLGIVSLVSVGAMAESHVSVSYSPLDYSEDGFDAKPTSVVVGFGSSLNEYFDIQGRAGFSVASDKDTELGSNVSFEVTNLYGVYSIVKIPTDSAFKPYGVLGWTKGKAKVRGLGGTLDNSESDVSYGLGFDLGGDDLAFNVEYIVYYDKDGAEVSSASIGFKHFF
jgi:hypothetical protein